MNGWHLSKGCNWRNLFLPNTSFSAGLEMMEFQMKIMIMPNMFGSDSTWERWEIIFIFTIFWFVHFVERLTRSIKLASIFTFSFELQDTYLLAEVFLATRNLIHSTVGIEMSHSLGTPGKNYKYVFWFQ